MKKQKIQYIFINPNTAEVTLKALQKIIIEKISQSKADCNTLTIGTTT